MPTTVHVQTRLALDLAKRLDQRAADANVTRSELLRDMLESALDATEAGNNTTTDPLVAEIADAVVVMYAGKVATTTHIDPYGTLTEAFRDINAWMVSHGERATGSSWETYLSDPAQVAPQDMHTQIYWLIA